jgi:hypothetical protein
MSDTAGLLTALLAVQGEAPTLPKNATNGQFQKKYTPLDTIVETIGPILHRHGLVWSSLPGRDDHGEPALTYRLAHAPSGEVLEGTMPLLLSKQDAQGQGSAITYARRYALCAVLNLVADDDDDGNSAAAGSAQQAGSMPQSGRAASDKQKALVRTLFTKSGVTQGEAKQMLAQAGVNVLDGESARDAVDRLRWPAVSELIDFLKEGPVRTGESDVPAAADEFTHPLVDEVPQELDLG